MGFWGGNLRVPKRKPKNRVVCYGAARLASSELRASCLVQHPYFRSFRALWVDLNHSKLILLMYLTVVKLSKPLERSNELD